MLVKSIFCGVALGFACIYPDNYFMPFMVLLEVVLIFSAISKNNIRYSHALVCGFSFHVTAMWWLWPTLQRFGDMPNIAAFLLMLLHSFLSGIQFALPLLMSRKMVRKDSKVLIFISAWVALELFWPRLFPWGFGNFFVHLKFISAYAEIVGVFGVSFLLLIIAYLIWKLITQQKSNSNCYKFLSFSLILLTIYYGNFLDSSAAQHEEGARQYSALVVQGNLSIEQKGRQEFFTTNLDLYRNLSRLEGKFDFIIWPESVVSKWYNLDHGKYGDQSPNPFPEATVPLLYGGLAYQPSLDSRGEPDVEMYNSALLKEPNSEVSEVYSKRILMPFGEYVPFTKYFPWIRNFTPIKKDFNIGKNFNPIEIKIDDDKIIKAGVSICYEDLSAEINRGFTTNGAELLLNLTNDAWYGNTPAPFQHDLLARQRAIESRRFMIRSTNTGLTSLINSRGERLKTLPLFSEKAEIFSFKILNKKTTFVKYGYYPLWLILFITLISCLVLDRRMGKSIDSGLRGF